MKSLIKKCSNCRRYTMDERCQLCGSETVSAHPAKYSPDDRYARYRSPLAYEDGDTT
jgi:H/ACA ribonucleoprotein complex subunit 3